MASRECAGRVDVWDSEGGGVKGEEQLIEAPCSSPSAVATDAGSASSPTTPWLGLGLGLA